MKFTELNISSEITNALEKLGIINCTEVQEKAIPLILAGKDIIAKSKTGSGKTFAFGVPIIENLDLNSGSVQVLIVSPTRELASQICDELRKIVTKDGTKVVPLYGGTDIQKQIFALKKSPKIVVGTPGRIMDHLQRRTLKLKALRTLVLDEADEMLNMGFKEDIESILKSTNDDHQTIMFSATMPKEISNIAKTFMKEPQTIEVSSDNNLEIKQYFVSVGLKEKVNALKHLLKEFAPRLSIIFCNTKRQVDELATKLEGNNYNILSIHGDMRQGQRKKIMQAIKDVNTRKNNSENFECNILIATDVAARGLDIKMVDMVFNYDVPNNPDYYIHRIGRTGRAGNTGVAYSLINHSNQLRNLKEYSKATKTQIEEYKFELSTTHKESKNSSKEEFSRRPYQKKSESFSSRIFKDEQRTNNKESSYGKQNNRNNSRDQRDQRDNRDNSNRYGHSSSSKEESYSNSGKRNFSRKPQNSKLELDNDFRFDTFKSETRNSSRYPNKNEREFSTNRRSKFEPKSTSSFNSFSNSSRKSQPFNKSKEPEFGNRNFDNSQNSSEKYRSNSRPTNKFGSKPNLSLESNKKPYNSKSRDLNKDYGSHDKKIFSDKSSENSRGTNRANEKNNTRYEKPERKKSFGLKLFSKKRNDR